MSDLMKSYPAQSMPSSDDLMDEFLCASSRGTRSLREDWLAREALQSILRLALAEQLLDIRRSVSRLVPLSIRPQSVKRARARRSQRGQPGQTQLAFGRGD